MLKLVHLKFHFVKLMERKFKRKVMSEKSLNMHPLYKCPRADLSKKLLPVPKAITA